MNDATHDAARLDALCINTMRMLAVDAVQKAQSGHPGTPLGASPAAYCLWQRHLRYATDDPNWINRDRFVLSNGHASAMLYALLYLARVRAADPSYRGEERLAVTLDDLKTFRQAGSRCTGHPEHGWTSGVETTTGPLGQGIAASVGMAVAGCWLAATFNRPGFPLFDYDVYAMCGDGCLMEGIGCEAASLAGHLKLGKLCWIYDDNHMTIEGPTSLAFTEDVAARFAAYGWSVLRVEDANDLTSLSRAYQSFRETADRPTLIIVHSHIGYGAPHKHDTRDAHGEPLGAEEVRLTKTFYGWDPDALFLVPDGVVEHFEQSLGRRGAEARALWQALLVAYRAQYPDLAERIEQLRHKSLPPGWDHALPKFPADAKGLATRDASAKVLNEIAERVPWLLGGAADLAPSTKTRLDFAGAGDFQAPGGDGERTGRNFHFGLREHAMCAIASGLALSQLRPYVASFLIFSDYCRAAVRLSAMMELPVIYIWTHDSISLGEDGPTHQPIEQLASLRAMPGLIVLRPADANEVGEAWRLLMNLRDRPVCLVLTRQAVPTFDRIKYAPASGVARGAYVLAGAAAAADVILIGTGSEVALCVAARERLAAENIDACVVSMPSWELFDAQDPRYRDSVLPPQIGARVAVEEAARFGWERYVGRSGAILGIDSFGLSAPGKVVAEHFGFDAGHVVAAAKAQLALRDTRAAMPREAAPSPA
ncbi:MAG: transketolase [Casimicrobiaceae bacterium]